MSFKTPHRPGRGMIFIGWVFALVFLTWVFGVWDEQKYDPQTRIGEGGGNETVLRRDDSGHYVIRGEINGTATKMLVDTGATYIAIPSGLADELGLRRGQRGGR